MSLDAGKLRHRIQLQAKVETRNAQSGARAWTWSTIANGTVWAAIEPVSVSDFTAAAAIQSKVVARIIIRHRADVNAQMRVLHGSKIYNIEGVLPDKDSMLEYITLACSEGVNQGA